MSSPSDKFSISSKSSSITHGNGVLQLVLVIDFQCQVCPYTQKNICLPQIHYLSCAVTATMLVSVHSFKTHKYIKTLIKYALLQIKFYKIVYSSSLILLLFSVKNMKLFSVKNMIYLIKFMIDFLFLSNILIDTINKIIEVLFIFNDFLIELIKTMMGYFRDFNYFFSWVCNEIFIATKK